MTAAVTHPVAEVFRELMASWPTGVTVVTALDGRGAPRGATCSSLTSVTLRPPTLLVCLQEGQTLDAIRSTGRLGVNLLGVEAAAVARRFAAAASDKFDGVRWRAWAGVPHLPDDAFAAAACTVADLVEVGDHTIVLARVQETWTRAGAPLLYRSRTFAAGPW